ncbi:MAG: reactive intermediate/imine deaminase [Candidatus Azotimanducaceae bacterium]|jgi:reactive intermediate/imine deaminase
MKKFISTDDAPAAIGTYSQAVVHQNTLYISGQIPLDPVSMIIVSDDIELQIQQVFKNLTAVCHAAGTNLNQVLKFTVYLTNLDHFPLVNTAMAALLQEPYPARAAIEVSALPKGSRVEVDAIVAIPD